MYGINSDFSVTDYLHLPKVNINAYFSLREKLKLKGGGGRYLRTGRPSDPVSPGNPSRPANPC